MIPFDEIDKKLILLGQDRIWLSDAAGYSEAAIREALAPNSKKRSSRLQKAISDAIYIEEAKQAAKRLEEENRIPRLLQVDVDTSTYRRYEQAAKQAGMTLSEWVVNACEKQARILNDERKKPVVVTGVKIA